MLIVAFRLLWERIQKNCTPMHKKREAALWLQAADLDNSQNVHALVACFVEEVVPGYLSVEQPFEWSVCAPALRVGRKMPRNPGSTRQPKAAVHQVFREILTSKHEITEGC